ncbi:nucleoside recognition domain-containing protein [Ferrimonas lipolytica]|uniref:Nucleoside transporter/FeoB GTPase Gate domain-containing protein n=1 Tax=Ferrimonas lipolytica TaxID=2724191 RepID=A0A6H1UGE7_9GAMM|nr:nucleoside recognition domain-containing protein [Ferrimonas lipolytica]QIZ78177.1 hypothetical protein HER31_15470 [Ferrimonas lipolytica]
MAALVHFFKQLFIDVFTVCRNLFRVMIPILIIIKVATEFGAIELFAEAISPLMGSIGLPGEMGLVWATTLLTNMYGGMVVLVTAEAQLTVAQMTTLFALSLVAHGLPIEGAIARQAGMRWGMILLSRIGGGFLLAWFTMHYYQSMGIGQEVAQLMWHATPPPATLMEWAQQQIENLAMIAVIIFVLLLALRVLSLLGVDLLMAKFLSPMLRLMGISKQATNLAMIGITVGLAYGGALLVQDARSGKVSKRDLFSVVLLLNLMHGIIEDLLLVAVTGADVGYLFWSRLIMAMTITGVVSHSLRLTSESFRNRWLYRDVGAT